MDDVSCPDCKGTRLQRYGKTAAGLQKYRCLDGRGIGCRRQFVAGSDRLIDPDERKVLDALLAADTPAKKIKAALPGISLRWIYELKRRANT